MKLTPEMLASVDGLSAREAGKRLGVGKTTITDARAKRAEKTGVPTPPSVPSPKTAKGAKVQQAGDGSLIIESTDSVPQTREHIETRMRERGFDPEKYVFTYGFSEWEAQTRDGIETLYSARASAREREKPGTTKDGLSADEIIELIENYEPLMDGGVSVFVPEYNVFVFCFADPQIGKVDINGGSAETVNRFLSSLDHACSLLDAEPASQIIWADLGDGIENFCNTSSQRQTNDLNLVEQVRVLRRLQVQGLMRLQEYAPVVHVSVPSNHSQNRVGFQQPASTAHDDWGIEVQTQLQDIFEAHGDRLTNPVRFVRPDPHLESVAIRLEDDTVLGFVHGHRSTSQKNLEQWWAGQSLGRQPTADADILFVGHFHNLDVSSVGKERYIITTPSLDNGSSWFTVSRGNVATAGVLTLRVREKMFRDLIIA
jgi:hypothetical protein